jgi:Fe2+ transport system protein FeoA
MLIENTYPQNPFRDRLRCMGFTKGEEENTEDERLS